MTQPEKPNSKESTLPVEREVSYVASMIAIGGLFAFLAWGVCDYLWPNQEFDWAKWVFVGGGLSGTAALTWVLADIAFY
jgi:hypothetical protein